MIEVGQRYTHSTDGGRYEVNGLPLTSGTMRRKGFEFVTYHCTQTLAKYVREKNDFIDKMVKL